MLDILLVTFSGILSREGTSLYDSVRLAGVGSCSRAALSSNDDFQGPTVPLPKADPMPDFPALPSFRSITVGDR